MNRVVSYLLLALLMLGTASFKRGHKLYKISGKITQTSSFCGGAYMPELIKQRKIPVPFPGKVVFIRRGEKNALTSAVLKKITCDSLGNFELKLPAGNYCIVEAYKLKKLSVPPPDQHNKYDSACLAERWKSCDYSFTVTNKDVSDILVNYHHPCSFDQPCLHYSGPLPP